MFVMKKRNFLLILNLFSKNPQRPKKFSTFFVCENKSFNLFEVHEKKQIKAPVSHI
jgi:hypothetical protein